MTKRIESDVESIARRLLDDAYTAWLRAEADAEHALRGCSDEKASARTAAFLAYEVAIDREEAAADDLQRLAVLAGPCLPQA